jgi:hypothetical protein
MHTSFPKGTTIWIKFRDGHIQTGKFSDHKSGKVLLESGETINLEDVRAMSIRKLEAKIEKGSGKKIVFRSDL